MAVKVEGRRIIRAPVQKVFQLVSRLDASPRVTGLWLTADLVERRSAGALTVHYRGYFAGIPVESVQRATLHPPHRIDFRQSRGTLKAFRGQYQLKPIEGDTEITLMLEAEVGIPLVSPSAARLVLHAFIERSLEKFKLTAERDLPRVVRRAADGGAAREHPPAEADEAAAAAAAANGGLETPAGPLPPVLPARRPGPPAPAPAQGETKPAPPGGEKKRRRRRRRRRGKRGGGVPGGEPSGPERRGAGESGSPSGSG